MHRLPHDRRRHHLARRGDRREGRRCLVPPGIRRLLARGGQRCHRAQFEYLSRGHGQSGRPAPGHQLDGHDRVAAEREEVVVDTDPVQAQHIGNHRRQHRLGVGARLTRSDQRTEIRFRQRLAVDLAVRGDREIREHEDHGGNHVVGQAFCGDGACRRGIDVPVRRDVADEADHTPGVGVRHDDRVAHPVNRCEGRLHLPQFHPEPADLHLVVAAPEELEGPGAPPHRVTGPVHPLPRGTERIGDEPRPGEIGSAEVAACDAGAGEIQLTGAARGDGPQPSVEDVRAAAVHGTAQARLVCVGDLPDECIDGALGGTVEIERATVGQFPKSLPRRRIDGLSAETDRSGPVLALEQSGGEHPIEERRGHLEEVEPVVDDVVGHRLRVPHGVLVEHVDGVAVEQPQGGLPRRVEAERPGVAHTDALASGGLDRRSVEVGSVALEEVQQVRMGDGHAFRSARRAGRVDDVHAVVWPQRGEPVRIGDRASGRTASAASTSGSSSTVTAVPRRTASSAARTVPSVTTTVGVASATMCASRSAGYDGSMGT